MKLVDTFTFLRKQSIAEDKKKLPAFGATHHTEFQTFQNSSIQLEETEDMQE